MKKLAAVLTLTLLSATVAVPAFAGPASRKKGAAPVDELALKGKEPNGTPVLNPEDTVQYSNTVIGGPTWDRPLADCSGMSASGVGVPRHVQPFHVSAGGAYDITSIQAGGWDGFLLLYVNSFDPNNPLVNCQGGNDDGANGIGESEIFGEPLLAGTQYILVTTSFDPTEQGAFTNTIEGPGTITLGSLGGNVDLSITKTGTVPATGSFAYTISVSNGGPDTATATTVTDTLPAGMTYVSDNCGGTVVGQAWTWAVGNMPNGAIAICTLTVDVGQTGCSPFTNTANVASTNFDTDPSDNSSTASNATEAVADGGFEDGTPSIEWVEASTNFGTPLCDLGCGTGLGTGPHSGNFWAWFGGIAAPETGSMTQGIDIPENSVLTFWFEAPVCSNTTDFVRAQIDGTTVWEATGTHPQCDTVGYQQITVDISAFADGGAHTLAFTSTISGNPDGSNFFIDDVSVAAATCEGGGGPGPGGFPTTFDVEVPTLSEIGLAMMALLMTASAFLVLRKR